MDRTTFPARPTDGNRRRILGHIQASGSLGRAEIGRRTGLTTQAVSNIIARLEDDGWLTAIPPTKPTGRRGPPAMHYALAAEGAYALGFELRPKAVLAVCLDLAGRTLWDARRALDAATPDAIGALLPALRDEAMEAVPGAAGRLLGAGIVMPGPFGRTAAGGQPTDLPGWDEIGAADHLGSVLGLEVDVQNDANAAAMAERVADPTLDTFACLFFGTGLGLGIVQDGRVVSGAFGNAGEIGQVPWPMADGPRPLEMLLSRLSLERHLARAGVEARDMDALRAALEDRPDAVASWLEAAAEPFAHVVRLVETLLDPRCIVLSGAMPSAILRRLVDATPLPGTIARRPDNPGPALRIGTCSRMAAARGAGASMLARAFIPAMAA